MQFFKPAISPVPDLSIYNKMTAFYTNNWSWNCTKLCACNDKGKCYQPYGTIGFYVVPYCEGTKCAMYLATFNEGTILSVMLNDSFAIANQSGQIVDNNGQILQAPNPFMIPVGPKSGYPVISSIGCDGCAEITSLHCPISTVEHDFLVNTFEMSLSESDGELSKNFTNATSVNECSANFSDPQHIGLYVENSIADHVIWGQTPKARCNCTQGSMLFYETVYDSLPKVHERNSIPNRALYVSNNAGKNCQDMCACDDNGNCYRPYGVVGFHIMPFCEGHNCAMYLATWEEGGLCPDKALEMNCAGHLINEKNEIIDSKNPETSYIGQKSGYPVITSIGCNGCKGLKKQQCLISTYQNLKIATGLEKVDVNYMNDIRLKLLIAAVIDTISTIFAVYLIIRRSHKDMGQYRWFLLNICIWSYITDLNIAIIYVPLDLFPAPGICILGLSNLIPNKFAIGILPFSIYILTLGATGTANLCAIYYRYRAALNKSMEIFTSKIWLASLALIHVIASLLPLIVFGISSTVLYGGFWSQILSLNSQYQGVMFLTSSLVCGMVDLSTLGTQIFLLLAVTELVGFLFIGVVVQLCIIYKLPKLVKNPSQNLLKVQRRFMVALLLQTIVPTVCLTCPNILMVISIVFKIPNVVDFMKILHIVSALHSTFNTLVMIGTIKRYRKTFVQIFRFLRKVLNL